MNDNVLGVWFGNRRVGQLRRGPSRTMRFQYEPAWGHGDGFAISQSLPLDGGDSAVNDERGHHFFANLLPEGNARDHIVRLYRVPDDDFDLLRAFGRECAGALVILPEGQEPAATGSQDYELASDEVLSELLYEQGWNFEDYRGNLATRLSLAGAQNKTSVALLDGRVYLSKGTSPPTHILKFDSLAYSDVLTYECFATMLAGSAGLPVVEFELRKSGQDCFALIKRYDRVRGDDCRILRLHQEDFCQALGYSSRTKYETDGGPTFARCYELVRDLSDAPLDDLESLLRWQIFNVMAGNSNGHAKNLSLLYETDGSIRLAQFYDLVPTRAIAHLDQRLALSVGSMRDPGNVGLGHWESLAAECGVPARVVLALVEEIAESLPANTLQMRGRFEELHGPSPALDRVESIVRRQCRNAIRALGDSIP